MGPIQFQNGAVLLTRVTPSNLQEAQEIFDKNVAYHQSIIKKSSENMAERCMNAPLPEVRGTRVFKYFMLVTVMSLSPSPVGVIDFYVGFPNFRTATIASLLVRENYHRKLVASEVFRAVRDFLGEYHPAVEMLSISVTDNNIPALRCLVKNQFERTNTWQKLEDDGCEFTAVMFKKSLKSFDEGKSYHGDSEKKS